MQGTFLIVHEGGGSKLISSQLLLLEMIRGPH